MVRPIDVLRRSTDRPAALYRVAEPFRTLEHSLQTAA